MDNTELTTVFRIRVELKNLNKNVAVDLLMEGNPSNYSLYMKWMGLNYYGALFACINDVLDSPTALPSVPP